VSEAQANTTSWAAAPLATSHGAPIFTVNAGLSAALGMGAGGEVDVVVGNLPVGDAATRHFGADFVAGGFGVLSIAPAGASAPPGLTGLSVRVTLALDPAKVRFCLTLNPEP
jgi:hypothetical protein